MNAYKQISELWKDPRKNLGEVYKNRLIEWRRGKVIEKVNRPTRLDKARALGYKAKQGYSIVRIRLIRGGKQRPFIKKGRKSGKRRRLFIVRKNYQWIAEERVNRRYPNLEVLNSYVVGKDGVYYWFEIILVDPIHPVIKSDPKISWIINKTGRTFRGLTSTARKARGLLNKGIGAEHIRPSLKANKR